MEDHNVPVLVDAKAEYTMQLITILSPYLYNGIRRIYMDAKAKSDEDCEPENILMNFQNLLSNIPKWNQEIINEEYKIIVDESECDYLEDLLTAIIVSHTKVLTAIRVGNLQKKINIKIPKIENFLHKTYIQLAREFWKNPYLFDDDTISKIEYQRNIRDCEKIISEGIQETIRKQLPVKHILKEYLGDSYEEELDEDISKNVSEQEMNNIKKMIKSEFEEYSKNYESDRDSHHFENKNPDETLDFKIDNIGDNENKLENLDAEIEIDNDKKDITELKIDNIDTELKIDDKDTEFKIDDKDTELKIDDIDTELKIDDMDNKKNISGISSMLNIDDVDTKLNIDDSVTEIKIDNLDELSEIPQNKDTISLDKIETPEQSTYIPVSEETIKEKNKTENLTDILYGDGENTGELVIDEIEENNNLKINDIDNDEESIKNEVLGEFKNLNSQDIKTIHIDEPEDNKKKKKKVSLFDDATDMSDDIIANNVQILN